MTSRTWADGPTGNTPITAVRMNGIEADLDARLLRSEYAPGSGIAPDTANPGLYLIATGGTITPDAANPGLYLIGA